MRVSVQFWWYDAATTISQPLLNNKLIVDTCSNGVNAENGDDGNCEIDAQNNQQLLTNHAWVAQINQSANPGLWLQGFRYNVLALTNDGKLAQYFMKDLSGDVDDSNNTLQSPLANSLKTNYLPTQVNLINNIVTENTTNQTYDYIKNQYVYTQCLNNQCVFAAKAQAFNPVVIFQQDGNFVYQIPANTLCNKDDSVCNNNSEVTWATNTAQGETNTINMGTYAASQGVKLIIHDDGNIVIYDKDGNTIWSTGKPFANACNLKNPNATVNSQNLSWQNNDDFLLNSTTNDCYAVTDANDSSKYYLLIAQRTDGNIAEYHCSFNSNDWYSPCGSENPIFSMQNNSTTKVTTTAGNVWKFQSDGNLVYYTASGSAIWDTWTVGAPNQILYKSPQFFANNSGVSYLVSGNINDTKAVKLILQNDGNLVLYNVQSQALWGSLSPNFLNQGLGFNATINAWFNKGTCHEQLDSYLVQTPVPACVDAAQCSQSGISNFQINDQITVAQTKECVAGKMGQL